VSVQPGILAGLRVVEVSAFVAAPLGGATLAALGADVIRVDPIGGGIDAGRWPLGPDGRSLYWAGLNQGKRSLALDLRSEEGRELVARLITCPGDGGGILLTNLPARGWLDYQALRARRDDLIMIAISGSRDGGTAVDYTVNAGAGFPLVTGPEGHEGPVNHVLPAWDLQTGFLAALGVVAADRHRRLTGEGRLVRRQGSGTFVAEPKVSWPLQMTSFTEQATANGRVASTRLLHAQREKADDEVAARLGVRPGELVHRIERLRLVDDTPMAVETSHLSARRFPGLARRLRQGDSLYRVLRERYATVPVAAEETIETATASPREAELLNTDTGSPMLVLSRHSFDADGVAVEWVQSWYRGDRYRFVARLTAP